MSIFGFNPVPKPTHKKKEKPVKEKPKSTLKAKTPLKPKTPDKRPMSRTVRKEKKVKRVEKVKREGIKTPSARKRNSFTDVEYQKAIEKHGQTCFITGCGRTMEEMHHVKYRSQSGRGKHRNAAPLCKGHHEQVHNEKEFCELLRETFTLLYGEHYYKDEYDLWFASLIDEPTKEAYEIFMEGEEERCRQRVMSHKEASNQNSLYSSMKMQSNF
ncbi:putative HNH endonuclease [Bacillus phage PBC5]|nr:putative HNH endonuclease [Bacillus phage PBC5]